MDPCRYNLPTGTDVAVIMPAETIETPCKRDVVVYKSAEDHPNGHTLMRIETIHPMYDPLMYVLMFPFVTRVFLLMHTPSLKNLQNAVLLCSITSTG